MNNILVVNVNWLGDAVFSTPVFQALKDNYPKAKVSCLCAPRVRSVLEFCPFIDEIIVYDDKKDHFWPWAKWGLIVKLRKSSFDAAFLLHRSATRALLIFLAGIPRRIGYCKANMLLTHPVQFQDEGIHRSDVYLKVLESYGLKMKNRSCRLDLKAQDLGEIDSLLKSRGVHIEEEIVVLHTAGNWQLKRWPREYFVELIKGIRQRFKVKVILSGSEADRDYCESIDEQSGRKTIVLAAETTLGQSLALYRRSRVVVSSDSGPLHLAHSVGAHVVGIYGPTRPEITGPRGKGEAEILFKDVGCNKAPCYYLGCTNNVCMQAVTVNDVLQILQKILN